MKLPLYPRSVEDSIDLCISKDSLSLDSCFEFIKDVRSGGNCLFVGTVRNENRSKVVQKLDFESYTPMALKEMRTIVLRAFQDFSLSKVALYHRVGSLQVGDIAVLIGVSTVHREDAFAACRQIIDQLKLTVPIWKKELYEDGYTWINAHP